MSELPDRFFGWVYGKSDRDKRVQLIQQRFKDEGRDFADYLKNLADKAERGELVEASQMGSLPGLDDIQQRLDEIKRMIQSGALVYHPPDGDVDEDILGNLLDMGT